MRNFFWLAMNDLSSCSALLMYSSLICFLLARRLIGLKDDASIAFSDLTLSFEEGFISEVPSLFLSSEPCLLETEIVSVKLEEEPESISFSFNLLKLEALDIYPVSFLAGFYRVCVISLFPNEE